MINFRRVQAISFLFLLALSGCMEQDFSIKSANTSSAVVTASPTVAPVPSATPIATPTPTVSPTVTPTATPVVPVATPTATPRPTATPTPVPTATATPVATATPAVTPTGTPTTTAVTFKTLKPALAVRGASCLMCHAQVNANVISDFGYGDTYFFDHDTPSLYDGNGPTGGIYGDWYEYSSVAGPSANNNAIYSGNSAWGAGVIRGSLIVPKVSLDHTHLIMGHVDPLSKKASMSLASVLQSPRLASDGVTVTQPAMTTGLTPATGTSAVMEKSKIYIGAPKDTDILALAPSLTADGFKAITVTGITPNAALPLSGLSLVSGSAGNYVTNSSTANFVCAGDVVIRGTLLLNSVKIKTDNSGCRLYVSGSVFVQGPVTYVANTGTTTPNLQITSAKLIGLGFNVTTLKRRLSVGGDRDYILSRYKTRSGLDPAVMHNAIIAEANKIASVMIDAGDSTTTNTNPMTGLLLNAPEVVSRYTGNFNGAVVAEIALFRLNQFIFTFDPVFETVPIFPALKSEILSITD